jgi:hypothetical protein
MGMSKIIAALAATFLSLGTAVFVVPAQANASETIVIIDAYFDKTLPGTHICVADSGCSIVPSNSTSTTFTHGTRMANIIIKNNPLASLVYIRAGSVNHLGQIVSANGREIANAFLAVPQDASVVSISIFNNGTGCRPSSTGLVNVSLELSRTQSAINSIVSRSGAVIAAAGNGAATITDKVDYPACLAGVTAVAKANSSGTFQSQGRIHPEMDVAVYPTTGLLGDFNTTSGLTAALASRWNLSKDSVIANSKQFLRLDVVR